MALRTPKKTRFSKLVSRSLKQHYDDAANSPVSLIEELWLERGRLGEALENLMLAKDAEEAGVEGASAKVLEFSYEVDARLDRVKGMAVSASRIDAAGQISTASIPIMLDNMTRAVTSVISKYTNVIEVEPQLIVEEISSEMDQEFQLTDGTGGTTLTPDRDAIEMDETVPTYPTNGVA